MSAYTDIRPDIIRYNIGYDIWNYTILISFISYTISHPISHPTKSISVYTEIGYDIVIHDIVYFTIS